MKDKQKNRLGRDEVRAIEGGREIKEEWANKRERGGGEWVREGGRERKSGLMREECNVAAERHSVVVLTYLSDEGSCSL